MDSTHDDSKSPEPFNVEPEIKSPRIQVTSQPASVDSMVTVRLSAEAGAQPHTAEASETAMAEPDSAVEPFPEPRRIDSIDLINGNIFDHQETEPEPFAETPDRASYQRTESNPYSTHSSVVTIEDAFENVETNPWRPRSGSSSSTKSHESGGVDWEELDKTEEEETRDEVSDEATAFLLARLEQENNTLATDPRFPANRPRKQSRPPSMQVIKKLVRQPTLSKASRYSVSLPEPPPMTELEFWAALVKDYPQTAQRLPTLTSNKIRGGVPPPLRGVVWMSMVGARDRDLAEQFDKLVQESSPYENLIGKDIGRSFPGVEMFREADGEGQRMLAAVLKSFSLYDKEIGYCQGLGFLVGPLLMQMGDRDAFCILVKLMEHYDLRSCFLPDLSGLHLRIYQFKSLLDQNMPELSEHLASLQIEAAYLSQWFLSFFAVTCPLPMLFRIYDVILAEGASETIMRVALSLMRRNEKKIMESNEFEEVMHLLLSRNLWDSYNCNADDLVNDFSQMTGIVTRESLKSLENSFKAARAGGVWQTFLPDATAAASRFLGRLWAPSHTPTPSKATLHTPNPSKSTLHTPTPSKSGGLAPGPAVQGPSRPSSFLRRTPSKQSIAISVNSADGSSEGTSSVGTNTTDATAVTRESACDEGSATSKPGSFILPISGTVSKEEKHLQMQIEDLLTAMSEMQRQQSLLSAKLQKEREEREDDHQAFVDLVECLKPLEEEETSVVEDKRQTMPPSMLKQTSPPSPLLEDRRKTMANAPTGFKRPPSPSQLHDILQRADQRIQIRTLKRQSRSSQVIETKQRLRESLVRSRDQLQMESSRSATLSRQLDEQEQETAQVRQSLRAAEAKIQEQLREKERLERIIQDMYGRSSRSNSIAASEPPNQSMLWRSDSSGSRMSLASLSRRDSDSVAGTPISPPTELRLGRSDSLLGRMSTTGAAAAATQLRVSTTMPPPRGSSLATKQILSTADHAPATEDDLLLELVNAKTSEAVARQELEEVKAKLDAMRKMLDIPTPSNAVPVPASGHRPMPSDSTIIAPSSSSGAGAGLMSFFTSKSAASATSPNGTPSTAESPVSSNATPPAAASSGSGLTGGFFGWGKRSPSGATQASSTASPSPAAREEQQAAAGAKSVTT